MRIVNLVNYLNILILLFVNDFENYVVLIPNKNTTFVTINTDIYLGVADNFYKGYFMQNGKFLIETEGYDYLFERVALNYSVEFLINSTIQLSFNHLRISYMNESYYLEGMQEYDAGCYVLSKPNAQSIIATIYLYHIFHMEGLNIRGVEKNDKFIDILCSDDDLMDYWRFGYSCNQLILTSFMLFENIRYVTTIIQFNNGFKELFSNMQYEFLYSVFYDFINMFSLDNSLELQINLSNGTFFTCSLTASDMELIYNEACSKHIIIDQTTIMMIFFGEINFKGYFRGAIFNFFITLSNLSP